MKCRGRVAIRLRPKNAEEMMADVAQTSALRHVAFGLSSWQLLSGLFFGHARAPSPAHARPPHSLRHVAFGLPSWQLLSGLSFGPTRAPSPSHARPPHSGSLALFES
ncbi:hypothetical protein DVH24_027666 [Malus domestica]|uniref:Uncharacterized protein n=1 Tax=Malus domestica TaxID=3750 RepID=A0A498H950_MALDO|nr:hypothetical protein DVH24_027666 [Malus domestica]